MLRMSTLPAREKVGETTDAEQASRRDRQQ